MNFKNATFNVSGDDFVIDDYGILKFWFDNNGKSEKAEAMTVLFGNNCANYDALIRYFDAKHGIKYKGIATKEERDKVIGDGQAMLRTLALRYGLDVKTLEDIAEAQWTIDTY